MITRYRKNAVPSRHAGQRRDMWSQHFDLAVHQIARHGDDIGLQCIEPVDHARHIRTLDGGADMQIGDLRDGEAVQRRRQARDGHRYPRDAGMRRALT